MKKILFKALIIFIILISLFINYGIALSQYGSTGDEVKNIQEKLKRWGYYNGEIDGYYGTLTFQAIRDFQSKNGLTVDGIAGEETLKAIGIQNKNNDNLGNNSSSQVDVYTLARLVYAEARGEDYTGQVAVAAVVLNRVDSSSFPNTLSGVIYESGAFDAVDDGQINLEPNQIAINAAQDAINGWDPTYRSNILF